MNIRFGCSMVHIGGPQSYTWMYAFIDDNSSKFWSVSAENHNDTYTIDLIGGSVIFIGI